MAFIQRNFHAPQSSFTPLFRLLEDFDNYSHQSNTHGRRSQITHWQPKFDVRETTNAYELYGELPGVNKNDVHIEFTDPQTILIRGKAERAYATTTTESNTEGDENASKSTHSSYQTTVEDDTETITSTEALPTPASSVAAGDIDIAKTTAAHHPQQPSDTATYWLSERSVGEFSRTFNFPSRVDSDAVAAAFKDGVLSIVVPKAKKHEARRINID